MKWELPTQRLEAGGIALRRFRAADAGAVVAACIDEDILRFTFMQEGLSAEQAQDWIERANERWAHGHPRFAIVNSSNNEVIGQIGFSASEIDQSAEVYYWILPSARRHGSAQLALGLLARWAFENGIERLFLLIHPENEASNSLALRAGFDRDGVVSAKDRSGHSLDMVSWSLLPDDRRPS